MKKILLTLTAMGLLFAQSYGVQFFEYDSSRGEFPADGLGFDFSSLDQFSPEFKGIMYPLLDGSDEINFNADPFPVFELYSDIHLEGVESDGNYSIFTSEIDDGNGNMVLNTTLVPATIASTYKGAPRVFAVSAEQAPEFESKDVLIDYGLLLGEGKGEAYIEYWYRTDSTGQWFKITEFDTVEPSATNEGFTSDSGFKYTRWLAGQQLGNTVKTDNAQIRVTAKYGAPSGWDGFDPFHQETYDSPTGGDETYDSPTGGDETYDSPTGGDETYDSPTGGTDPYTTDSDGDGVMDAYDYAPYDSSIWEDPNSSPDGF
jgi:hypothetical protein